MNAFNYDSNINLLSNPSLKVPMIAIAGLSDSKTSLANLVKVMEAFNLSFSDY